MRQLPLAALNFESAIGLLPTGHELISGTGNPNDPFSNDPTSNGWGWRTKILPYMDQGNLNTLFDLTLPIADPVNRELAETVIPNFSCPSDPTINDSLYFVSGSLSMSLSNYLGNGGSFEWSFVAQDRTRSDGILLRTTNASHQGIPLSVLMMGRPIHSFVAKPFASISFGTLPCTVALTEVAFLRERYLRFEQVMVYSTLTQSKRRWSSGGIPISASIPAVQTFR